MHPRISLLVKKEIVEYLKVGFIRPINYSPWISNVVPIAKLNGEIRFYMNFRDINKDLQR